MLAKPHFRVSPATAHCPLTTDHRPAFTLVEMLIAMVLTLILVTAIAQFYAIVGESVKDGRAMIELGGQLRAAVERLKSDLDLITVTVVPWTDDGAASGYFEYFEGRGNDFDANGNGTADSAEDLSDGLGGAANTIPDVIDYGVTNMIGDGDDFLAFTIRTGGAPFTGRYCRPAATIITSNTAALAATDTPVIANSQLAEVVWWVGFDDTATGATARTWDFIEPRQLYRRQLLIRPELGQLGGEYSNTVAAWLTAQQDLMRFWQYNDISASIRAEFNSAGTLVYRIRANSLADLTKRENRFAHMPLHIEQSSTTPPFLMDGATFPHAAAMTPFSEDSTHRVSLLLPCFSAKSTTAGALTSYALQTVSGVNGENPGEDIMLSNLLAFDVQVFDPYARLWPNDPSDPNTSTTALVPGDPGPGYFNAADAVVNVGVSPAVLRITPPPLLGLGAYVDLGYYRYANTFAHDDALRTLLGYPMPYFAGSPSVPPGANATNYYNNFGYNSVAPYTNNPPYVSGATYDTWSLNYERDGIDQSGNGTYDLQTNGIDDLPYINGVDDVSERDTIPPYSQPLRGLQVRIRLYEPSTRQARQATVATDFVTE